MNPFFESLQKELGKKLAQGISVVLTSILSLAAISMPEDKQAARLILLSLAGLALFVFISGLLISYFSYRKSKKVKKDNPEDNPKDYIFNPQAGSWIHKKNLTRRICANCKVNNLFSPLTLDSDKGLFICPACGNESKNIPFVGFIGNGQHVIISEN